MKWVGRAIRRLEDPALVTGRGRFTADLPARIGCASCAARSPPAGSCASRRPRDAQMITRGRPCRHAPIRPMLHKFNYRPIEQPLLADGRRALRRRTDRRRGRADAGARPKTSPIASRSRSSELPAVIDAQDALRPMRRACTRGAGNVMVEGRFATADFDAALAARRIVVSASTLRSRRQNATPLEARAAHAAFDPATGRVTLTCATQMPHLLRTAIADVLGMPESDLRVVAPDVGGGFGQKMSLPAEYVVLVWLARKLARQRRLERGPARESDRRVSQPRPIHRARRRVRPATASSSRSSADVVANIGAYSCFPDHLRRRAVDGAGRIAGPLRCAAYRCVARGVATHTCTMAPYRGVSRPVITSRWSG